MKHFLFETLKERQLENLDTELNWLSGFRIKACGIEKGKLKKNTSRMNLFQYLLVKNEKYRFLSKLDKLLTNPIFFEFGWNTELNRTLQKAVTQSKPSLLKVSKPRRVLSINSQRIEISRLNQPKDNILINQDNLKEYDRLKNDHSMLRLERSIRLQGLRMLNTINLSKKIAVLPSLGKAREFTLYFLVDR